MGKRQHTRLGYYLATQSIGASIIKPSRALSLPEHTHAGPPTDSPEGRPWVLLVTWIYSAGTIRTDFNQHPVYIRDTDLPLEHDPVDLLTHDAVDAILD